MSEHIHDKIRKLLAIAGDPSASEAERATALATASRLAERHAIDLSSVGKEGKDWGTVVLATFSSRCREPRAPAWSGWVSAVLEEFFFVRLMSHRRHGWGDDGKYYVDTDIEAFGASCDRQVAVYVWNFLRREFLRLRRQRQRQLGRPLTGSQEQSFYSGVATGVWESLRAARSKPGDELTRLDKQALIVAGSQLDAAFAEAFPDIGEGKKSSADPDWHGYHAGREVQVHTPLPSDQQAPLCLGVSQ